MEGGDRERETGCGMGERGRQGEQVDRTALQRAPRGVPAPSHCVSHVHWEKKMHNINVEREVLLGGQN